MSIIVTGGNGMVGKSLQDIWEEPIYLSSKDYDLTKEVEVIKMYEDHKPSSVIHLAAKAGGIMDNIRYPSDYFVENIMMNTLVLNYAQKFKVKNFIGMLSTCIYPDVVNEYPMTEDDLHKGPPTKTNFSYAYAKRSLAVQIEACNEQYATNYSYLIPSNLYGEHDKWGENSHFIAALIKKIVHAKKNNKNKITLFGTGQPLRQFLYAPDLAKVIKYMFMVNKFGNYNVAAKENLSILEMAQIALRVCDAENIKIEFDVLKPDGQFRKDVTSAKLNEELSNFLHDISTPLYEGIKITYNKIKNEI